MGIRQQKVGTQIRRIVSEVLLREIADPRIEGLVTVTKVEVTPDLRYAKVFVSVLKRTGPAGTVLHGLKAAARRIQTEVAAGLPIRVAPRLEFVLDESLKKEAEIFRTLDAVARERESRGGKPGEAGSEKSGEKSGRRA